MEFRLKGNAVKMARSAKKLWQWIKNLASTIAAGDNDGVEQVVVEMIEGHEYRLQLTPKGGFFIVVVKLPGDWDPTVRDVRLLFSLSDLYLVGFLHNDGVWRLYDNADVVESLASNPNNDDYWKPLGFCGGYVEGMWALEIGMQPLFYALRTLCMYNGAVPANIAVRLAMFQFIVVISKASRFRMWMDYLKAMLRGFRAEPLKNPI